MLRDPKREAEIEFEIKVAKEPWRKVLLNAAQLLRTQGWCKMLMSDEKGAHCALGAIGAISAGDHTDFILACIMLRNRLKAMGRSGSITVWNDDNDAHAVISTLESVARE